MMMFCTYFTVYTTTTLQLILAKGILCQDSKSINVLIKMRYAFIQIVFNINSKKEF